MGIMTVDGIATFEVKNDALVIQHGMPRGEFITVLQRQNCEIDSIVIASRHGELSIAAMQWMAAAGITWTVLTDGYRDGNQEHYDVYPICHSATRTRQALLRRSQAAAQNNSVGVAITRHLLSQKFLGQRDVAARLGSDVALEIDTCRRQLTKANLAACRQIESRVAKELYWDAWKSVEIQFADSVPDFWRRFPSRTSSISGNSPRNAACPINALLNYAYGILESYVTSACHTMDLDPLLGILHKDANSRASMSADLMEPGRPVVDGLILDLLDGNKFKKRDFVVTTSGVFRLRESLTKSLAVMVTDYMPDLYPVWETVLNLLVEAQARGQKRRQTPLTHANAKARYAKEVVENA